MKRTFFKIISLGMALCFLCSLLSACKKDGEADGGEGSLKTVVFPTSYYDYFGYEASEDKDAIEELGEEYYSKVSVKSGTLVIEGTEAQLRKLIGRNNYHISEVTNQFMGAGDGYSVTETTDYTSVEFVLDENIADDVVNSTVESILMYLAMNQLLQGAGEDWSVEVIFTNAQTGENMLTANIPADDLNMGQGGTASAED